MKIIIEKRIYGNDLIEYTLLKWLELHYERLFCVRKHSDSIIQMMFDEKAFKCVYVLSCNKKPIDEKLLHNMLDNGNISRNVRDCVYDHSSKCIIETDESGRQYIVFDKECIFQIFNEIAVDCDLFQFGEPKLQKNSHIESYFDIANAKGATCLVKNNKRISSNMWLAILEEPINYKQKTGEDKGRFYVLQ